MLSNAKEGAGHAGKVAVRGPIHYLLLILDLSDASLLAGLLSEVAATVAVQLITLDLLSAGAE